MVRQLPVMPPRRTLNSHASDAGYKVASPSQNDPILTTSHPFNGPLFGSSRSCEILQNRMVDCYQYISFLLC